MMLNTTYGMIHTFGDFVVIKSFVGAFWIPSSSRSSTFAIQHPKVATMDQLGQPRKCLTVGSTGLPFSKTPINSSSPMNNVRKKEWSLVEGMKCPSNQLCSMKSLTGYLYILLAVDYVEDAATKTNDAKVVVDFLKSNIFCRFGVPKALISDQGSHFCN
ncbi:hypothetical protein CR513_37109, partial [Mucuna pruriens]